ncbi:MAG: N-acetyltransferase [Candidatus Fermentibacterota bacterium]
MTPVLEEVADRRGRAEFVHLPFRLYRNDPYWVPPLKREQMKMLTPGKHPFHEHADVQLFLARDSEGTPVGRVAAVVNHTHNAYHSERTGFFGFLESVHDGEVFAALLDRASQWLRDRGMDRIRGPMNFSTNEECGMLVKGFGDSPLLMMPYNPSWYPEMMERAGFRKVRDLLAYSVDRYEQEFDRLGRIADLAARRTDATVRSIEMGNLSEEIPRVMDVYNECWKDNWGFVPMTEAELVQLGEELKLILDPRLAPIIEDEGRAVAFAIALPDANRALKTAGGSLLRAGLALKVPPFKVDIDRVRILLLGVREDYRNSGFEAILINEIVRNTLEMGIDRGELSWILEDNVPMRRVLEKSIGAVQYKTYRIYDRNLG